MVDIRSESSAKWFAVYTMSRHEKRVSAQLQERKIETFLPLYRAVHQWKNRTQADLELPLFPSYVFARIPARGRSTVFSTPGVFSIVGSRTEPWPLPDHEIETLRSGLSQYKHEPYPYLVTGDRVRIMAGPLSGMEGVLVEQKNGQRVVLTIEQIMSSISVEVEVQNLEPLRPRLVTKPMAAAQPFVA